MNKERHTIPSWLVAYAYGGIFWFLLAVLIALGGCQVSATF